MSKNLKAHIAVFTANLIYGGNYSIAKAIMPAYILPFGFILVRVAIGTVLFFLSGLFIKEKIEPADLRRLIVCGFFGVALNQLMFFAGLAATSPINAALIMTTNPVTVLLMAHIIIKEKISPLKIAGITTGLAGAVLLILLNPVTAIREASAKGDFFILINSISFAIFLVIIKPLMSRYHPVTLMKWVFLAGLFMVFPFGYDEVFSAHWDQMEFHIWLGVIYVVVGTTFVAYLFNIEALRTLSPSVVSFYIYLQPVFAVLFAVISGKNHLVPMHLLCAAMIFAGVYMVSRNQPSKARSESLNK